MSDRGLDLTGKNGRLTYQQAIGYCEVIHKNVARMMRQEMPAVGEVPKGGDRVSPEAKTRVDIINGGRSLEKGTSAIYLTRRIKAVAPEIARRLAAGEFKSVRAAAIEAGIVKDADPLDRALRTLRHQALRCDRRTEVVTALEGLLEELSDD